MNQLIQDAIDKQLPQCKEDPNAAASFMVDISMLTMAQAYNEIMNELDPDCIDEKHHVKLQYSQQYVNDSMFRAHIIWKQIVQYLRDKYHVYIEESFFLIIMSNYANPDNLNLSDITDPTTKIICNAIVNTLQKLGTDIFHVGDTNYNQILEKENKKMEYAMEHTDPNMLKSFFQIFKELGKFHRDINQYTSEDDKKKYMELMDIYQHMLSVIN